jgi:hypothetical protein
MKEIILNEEEIEIIKKWYDVYEFEMSWVQEHEKLAVKLFGTDARIFYL